MTERAEAPKPKACAEDMPIVPPPASVIVEVVPRVTLYTPDGRPLV